MTLSLLQLSPSLFPSQLCNRDLFFWFSYFSVNIIQYVPFIFWFLSVPNSSIVLMMQVLDLLKTAFGRNPGHLTTTDRRYPIGLLQLNAMRLADIFSDDTYFRSCIIVYFVSYHYVNIKDNWL